MAGYADNVGAKEARSSNWISLKEGTYVFRILPPASSYFDPNAEPLKDFRVHRKVIFDFPLAEGAKNITVDRDHIVSRAVYLYQKSLGDWETQKKIMKQNGMNKCWSRPRAAYNVITKDKKDRPYWLDLPKTADEALANLIKADPMIIDLEKGRAIQMVVTGDDQFTRKYAFAVAKASQAIKLEFDVKLLDEIAQVMETTPVSWRDIKEPTVRAWAIKIIKDEQELKKQEAELSAGPSTSAPTTTASSPAGNSASSFDDGGFDAAAPVPPAAAAKPATKAPAKAPPPPAEAADAFMAEAADADKFSKEIAAAGGDAGEDAFKV